MEVLESFRVQLRVQSVENLLVVYKEEEYRSELLCEEFFSTECGLYIEGVGWDLCSEYG